MEKITVCLTFDFDADSVQVRQLEEPGRISKGQFAVRRGIPRVLSLLNKFDIKSTFFTCGWVAQRYPDLTRRIVDHGHELAAHGYIHEYFDTLSIYEERAVIEKTDSSLREVTEQPIKGFRAPYWKLSKNTFSLISKKGYMYDSSLMDDDRPYILHLKDSNETLIEFPVEWYLDDWVLFETQQHPPSNVLDIWINHFNSYLEMEDIVPDKRVMTLTCHPACIGHAYRIKVLEKLIDYMIDNDTIFSRMDHIAERLIG